MTDWTERHFRLAEHVATWSKDPHTKVGCVIVGENPRDVALGYNGFPPGIADTPSRLEDRELKRKLTQHAERNALDNARFSCSGATLVTTMHPCLDCAKSIVSKGIRRVYCPTAVAREPWASDAQTAWDLLLEADVEVTFLLSPTWVPCRPFGTK